MRKETFPQMDDKKFAGKFTSVGKIFPVQHAARRSDIYNRNSVRYQEQLWLSARHNFELTYMDVSLIIEKRFAIAVVCCH